MKDGNIVHADAREFDSMLKKHSLVLVDFFADWCGPCKMVAPAIEEVSKAYKEQVVVAKVDIDQENELAMRYGIQSIPTVILFKDGEMVAKEIGAMPLSSYTKIIDDNL